MRIFTVEECTKMIERRLIYNHDKIQTCFVIKYEDRGYQRELVQIVDEIQDTYNYNPEHIYEAIEELRWPDKEHLIENLNIYLAPYPVPGHSNGCYVYLDTHSIIIWSKGTPEPRHKQHYLFIHELGHAVEQIYATRISKHGAFYDEYLPLREWPREIIDVRTFKDSKLVIEQQEDWKSWDEANWVDDPQQWFAEDFRYLYGGPQAHQNSWSCSCPRPNEKIKEFFESLIKRGQV